MDKYLSRAQPPLSIPSEFVWVVGWAGFHFAMSWVSRFLYLLFTRKVAQFKL